MEDLTNIWNADDELNEEELLNYVSGKSGAEDTHAIERTMVGSSFVNDGVEGLQKFSSAQKINAYVQQINEDLQHKLSDKKIRKKRNINIQSWEIIALIIVVLLCILGYVIVEMIRK
ncbi:MAG TPA: hypothetical protein VFW07_24610 [Parafilimonas sp.]|nr:hypothetical protein [Parafilimonas sp.]